MKKRYSVWSGGVRLETCTSYEEALEKANYAVFKAYYTYDEVAILKGVKKAPFEKKPLKIISKVA